MSCSGRTPYDTSCSTETLPDGRAALSEEFSIGQGVFTRVTEVLYPGGLHVTVSSGNEYVPPGQVHKGRPTRAVPPLTTQQVQAIAEDWPWPLVVPKDFAAKAEAEIAPFVDEAHGPAAVIGSAPKS